MSLFIVFFFNDTATTEIYTLSLHDALPIYRVVALPDVLVFHDKSEKGRKPGLERFYNHRNDLIREIARCPARLLPWRLDRKSTRLNSSHANISYAVFCLKKKKSIRGTHSND